MTDPTKDLDDHDLESAVTDLEAQDDVTMEEYYELLAEQVRNPSRDELFPEPPQKPSRDERFPGQARKPSKYELLAQYASKPVRRFIQADGFVAHRVNGEWVPGIFTTEADGDGIWGNNSVFELRGLGGNVRIQVPYDADLTDVRRVLPKLGRMIDRLIEERDRPAPDPAWVTEALDVDTKAARKNWRPRDAQEVRRS